LPTWIDLQAAALAPFTRLAVRRGFQPLPTAPEDARRTTMSCMDGTLPSSYRSLVRIPGLGRVMVAALLGRVGGQMFSVAMVPFALERFHSPTDAGVVVFASILPGIAVSPLAGALLDRIARAPLIMLDFSIAAGANALVVVLAYLGILNPGLLIAIAALSSLTYPLSGAGIRTLFPLMVPRHLWDRANALDSVTYVVAAVIGAPLAATIAGFIGRPQALIATAVIFCLAALSLVGAALPSPVQATPGSALRDARQGLAYLLRNQSLRGLAASISILNVASGVLIVGLPVLVLVRLHANAAFVGLLWALSAVSGGIAAVVAGRHDSQGRERGIVVVGMGATAAALAVLTIAPSMLVAALAMLIYGAAGGPIDIAMFSMRQRRTDPAWYGRAFAVSMSLNYSGSPLGSLVAGPLIGVGLGVALVVATGFGIGAALLAGLLLPGRTPREAGPRSPSDDSATSGSTE
jgi:predicted MFS family arabinose efflux permease